MTNKETAKRVLSLLDYDAEEIVGEIYKLAEDITNEEDEDEQEDLFDEDDGELGEDDFADIDDELNFGSLFDDIDDEDLE